MSRDKALHELIDFVLGKIENHRDQATYCMAQAHSLLCESDNHPMDIAKELTEATDFLIKSADHFEKANLYYEVKAKAEKLIPTNNEAQA